MSRSDKIMKALVYLLGGLATMGFLITKNAVLLSKVTTQDYNYGDLYRFAKIYRFKPSSPLPSGPFARLDSMDQGKQQPSKDDVILLGDSFSFSDFGETPFHMQLQKKLQLPMFSIYNNHHEKLYSDPYLLFRLQTNHSESKHLLVYEIVERSIHRQFGRPIATNEVEQVTAKGASVGFWPVIQKCVFDNSEPRNEALLKHNIITSPVITVFDTAAFELFRQLPPETPLYSLSPPFLYYVDEVDCFQSVHDEQLVSQFADSIALLDRNLRQNFGCTLLFVPIPDKITLYSHYALAKNYDDFLPRLCSALKARGVHTVELLPEFQKQTDLLYWPTDTHWNNRGIRIAVEQTLKAVSQSKF